jgi:hypothetical protein
VKVIVDSFAAKTRDKFICTPNSEFRNPLTRRSDNLSDRPMQFAQGVRKMCTHCPVTWQ